VDSGDDRIGRNESGAPAVDVRMIMAPVGGAFSTELDAWTLLPFLIRQNSGQEARSAEQSEIGPPKPSGQVW
jgi:hypothetical protein